jgi:UDP-N-acetyl-D-glucosamine dehydrogenase
MPFYPGPGVGGHCIPEDPYYLIESARKAGFKHKFLLLARKINDSMPAFCVKLLERELKASSKKLKGSKIALLGLSYKANVDDLRESPSLKILNLLQKKGAKVRVYDPFVSIPGCAKSLQEAIEGCDALVIGTDHKVFVKKLKSEYLKRKGVKIVIDTRNCLNAEELRKLGIRYKGVGR